MRRDCRKQAAPAQRACNMRRAPGASTTQGAMHLLASQEQKKSQPLLSLKSVSMRRSFVTAMSKQRPLTTSSTAPLLPPIHPTTTTRHTQRMADTVRTHAFHHAVLHKLIDELGIIAEAPFGTDAPHMADPSLLTVEDLLRAMSEAWQEDATADDQEDPSAHAAEWQDAAAISNLGGGGGGGGGSGSSSSSSGSGSHSETDQGSLSGRRRQLLQTGVTGTVATSYANAFQLVFGNFFDLLGGGGAPVMCAYCLASAAAAAADQRATPSLHQA